MSIRDIPDDAYPITPNDSTDLPIACLGLLAGAAGTVKVTTKVGTVVTIAITAGSPIALRVRRVWATGTTATGLVALIAK